MGESHDPWRSGLTSDHHVRPQYDPGTWRSGLKSDHKRSGHTSRDPWRSRPTIMADRDNPDSMLRTSTSYDADLTISINDRCRTCDLYQYAKLRRRTIFSKFQNGLLPIRPLVNLQTSRKPPPTDGTLPFRARNVLRQKSSGPPSHIASHHYFLWENFSAIGDKTALR